MTRTDVIENIQETLTEATDYQLAETHNRICSRDIEVKEDSEFAEIRAFKVGVEIQSLKIDEPDYQEAREDPSRIIAEYSVQEKARPSGRNVRVRNEYWDVTGVIEDMDEEEIRDLRDADYSTDSIVHDYSDHDGPHDVYVVDQINEYWNHTRGEPLWE